MTTEGPWVLALDEIEAHVLALSSAPHAATAALELVPPAELGPLPHELAERAAELLADCRAREDELTREMARLRDQIERGRHPDEHRGGPLFLDQSL